MNDLIFVLRQLKEVIESVNLPHIYNQLAAHIQQAATSSTPEQQAQIKQFKEQIRQTHNSLSTEDWSYTQKQVFEKFGASDVIGTKGLKAFDSAFSDNSGVPTAVSNELTAQSQKISQLLTNTNNVLSSLGNLNNLEKTEEGRGLIQVVFKEQVLINNLPELTTQSETWANILRAYSILADQPPENTKIIASNKVNPFLLCLSTDPMIAVALFATVKALLSLWTDILKARQAALTIEEMEIDIASKEVDLMKKIEVREEERVKIILEDIADTHHKEGLHSTKLNDGKTSLLKFGPRIYDFIKGHGEVNASYNGKSSPVTSNLQLSSIYRQVFDLENKVNKLLEAINHQAPDETDKNAPKSTEEKDESKTDGENKRENRGKK